MKKNILLIATGGTIASQSGKNGLVPQMPAEFLLSCVPEIKEFCNADALQLYNIDSTNVTPQHWIKLAACIQENYDKYDGFVVCHGTDTMAYTAAALSYLIQNSGKPIVFTGAQKSLLSEITDARKNLRDSILCALDDRSCDVMVVFSGNIIAGTRAKKTATFSFDAFSSINFPVIGKIQDDMVLYYIENNIEYLDEKNYFFIGQFAFIL